MNKKIISIFCLAFILIIVYAVPTLATTGTVNTETLNLRKEASTNSDVIEQLNNGDKVEILSEEDGWYKVTYKDYTGYVSKDYVTVSGEVTIATSETTETVEQQQEVEEQKTEKEVEVEEVITTGIDNTVKSNAKIRIIPTITSNVIGEVNEGTQVDIITTTNNWAFIGYMNITGWIPLINLKEKITVVEEVQATENEEENNNENPVEEPENNEEEKEVTDTIYETTVIKYINSASVRVRAKPTTESDIIATLIKNTDVTVLGESGDWYKVKYDGESGYIRKDLLSDEKEETTSRGEVSRVQEENIVEQESSEVATSSNSSLGEQIVAYAKQYLGCPYVYGGSGSSSFDCSGFTMYVYKHFGYNLSHSALAQSRTGTYIAKEDLQPGDLVFFLEYQTMDEVGHCGIYIGGGEFIHASSGTGYCVKISDLTTGSYLKRYDSARRLY